MKGHLNRLFSSTVRAELLALFLSHPTEGFYLHGLAKELGKRPSSLQRELENLERIGLLTSSKEANVRYYRIDQDCPIYPDLKAIFLKTVGIGDFLRQRMSSVKDVQICFIYGSVAKGNEEIGSDIDIMIIGRLDLDELSRAIDEAEESLRREINCTVFTPEEWEQKQGTSFVRQIRAQPKIYLIGSEDAL
ncbi:hypothetical protein AMJ39_04120 [candidate division TA06 bacterium DG_24]|uniref:Polymerase beta nucleotidyltransferase domain-containing protein n=3 Tax=Bacteria division TA06 TaxID=1156500 RepID=A0A0S8JAA7_UNCT6|nr:MAG: hypothetical protein AMJ39_04120 [candidate division TA06 bacterium DG_24]KPK70571.1 MAG: hypothetical protein AMJ82_02910 [candidate division TA06 bacterium SM23_40]KPL06432.1 MAG: hypothetical protein AMJ71_09705 [candidate division TA06 bacterium SM1_40]